MAKTREVVALEIGRRLLEDGGVPFVYARGLEPAQGGIYLHAKIWVSDADIAREQATMEEFKPAPGATGEGTDRCANCNQMRVEHKTE